MSKIKTQSSKPSMVMLEKLCKRVRYDILTSTTKAGSGHPTSSLSAVELMTALFFGGYLKLNPDNPHDINNDRVIFSKGHASPLLYSLFETAGLISPKELLTLRQFSSRLQGHPTPEVPFVDIATGSLGQGLSAAVGMSLAMRLDCLTLTDALIGGRSARDPDSAQDSESKPSTGGKSTSDRIYQSYRLPHIFVLLGDSELAEGQNWEAMEIASYYKLSNIIGILDMSRLGQQGETMLGWHIHRHEARAKSFGCHTILVENGNDLHEVIQAFDQIQSPTSTLRTSPLMIIAKTIKGKGVSFLEDKDNWHGKTLSDDQLKDALKESGKVDVKIKGKIADTGQGQKSKVKSQNENEKLKTITDRLASYANLHLTVMSPETMYCKKDMVATREAYGDALADLGAVNEKVVALDAEMANSTFEDKFQKKYPERFFEMFIAEQNMVSAALGMSKMGYIPFVSTFAAFLTRTFDQIRMAQYSVNSDNVGATGGEHQGIPVGAEVHRAPMGKDARQNLSRVTINIVGSHAGVSIGADGPSQMGLEDIAMMRPIQNSTVLYPADATSAYKLTLEMAKHPGISYLRTTRGKTPVIYDTDEEFRVGGLKIHQAKFQIPNSKLKIAAVVIAAGITLHEALKAQKILAEKSINITVVDLYSVKPLDVDALRTVIKGVKHIIVVEDHYEAGGIGEAVLAALHNIQYSINNKQSKTNIVRFTHLCVRKTPRSGTSKELLWYMEIDAQAIIKETISPQF